MARLVLDANPLLILFYRQKGWERVQDILDSVIDPAQKLLLSAVNLGEVYYSILRSHGPTLAEDILERITEGPIEVVLPTLEQTIQAAKFKAGGGISYADCFAGALALDQDFPVLTNDPEFDILIPHGVKVERLY